jgi:hypothetical protein
MISQLKAGSVGSNPNSASNKSWPHSSALRQFLGKVGDASFALNTLVVGLDAVEQGHEKPAGLNISWSPSDRTIAARKSRRYAVEAFLIRASEQLTSFNAAIIPLSQFETVRSKWDAKTGKAAKLIDVSASLLGESYLICAGAILIGWRNRIVHDSKFSLHADQRRIWLQCKKDICEKYGHLNAECLLKHAEEEGPTLKDASCLIAMSIKLAKAMDQATYTKFSKEDLDSWIASSGISDAIRKIRRETKKPNQVASVMRLFEARGAYLYNKFEEFYGPAGEKFE